MLRKCSTSEQLPWSDAPARAGRVVRQYRYTRWRWWVMFGIIDLVGAMVMTVWAVLRRLLARRAAARTETPRRILIVQLDHLGDAILSLGLVQTLRTAYPQAEIDVLASRCNATLWRACPQVSHVWQCHATRWDSAGRFRWIGAMLQAGWRLRRRNYDWGIDVRGEFPAVIILALAGTRRRVGWASGGGASLLTDVAPYLPGRHEILSRQALLQTMGLGEMAAQAVPRWSVADVDRQALRLRFPSLARAQTLVVLHLQAGTAAKQWSLENWQALAVRLLRLEPAVEVVLVGTGDADAGVSAPRREWPTDRLTNAIGLLSLPELAALLQQATLLVTADSGPGHLAAAVGTPVLTLFSGTNQSAQWRPWGARVVVMQHSVSCAPCHRRTCPFIDHPCMQGIRAEAVTQQVRALLASPWVDVGDVCRAVAEPESHVRQLARTTS